MTTPSLDALPAFSLSSCLLPMNIKPAPPNMTTAAGGASTLAALNLPLGGGGALGGNSVDLKNLGPKLGSIL